MSMRKLAICLVAAAFLVGLVGTAALAGDAKKTETTVTGYITDSHCKGEGAKDGHKDCAVKCAKEKGATLGIWDAATSKFWALDDQKKALEFAGEMVTVKGMADETAGTLKVATIAKAEKKNS